MENEVFVARIEALCDEKGVTVAQMLRDTHQGKNNVYKWKALGCSPSYNTMRAMAEYFDVSLDYLRGNSEERNVSMVNSMYQSPNSSITIGFSSQEIELITKYRSLNLEKQMSLIKYLGELCK